MGQWTENYFFSRTKESNSVTEWFLEDDQGYCQRQQAVWSNNSDAEENVAKVSRRNNVKDRIMFYSWRKWDNLRDKCID